METELEERQLDVMAEELRHDIGGPDFTCIGCFGSGNHPVSGEECIACDGFGICL